MTDRHTRLDATAITLLLGCCVLWGLNQVAAKAAMAEIPPLLQAGARSLGAAVCVALWSWGRGRPMTSPGHGWAATGAAGLLAGALFAGEFACIFLGLQHTTASRMAVFLYLSPFVVAMGMPLLAHAERLDGRQWAGLAAAFAGVALAFADGFGAQAAGPRQWLGDALGVVAAILWGATTLVVRGSRLSGARPELTLWYQLAVCGVLLLLAGVLAGERWPVPLSTGGWLLIGFQTVIVSFASYLLWFWLVRHYPATQVASFVLLTPVFGLIAGATLLDEPVTMRLVVALVAVSLGIAVVTRPRPPARAALTQEEPAP